MRDAGVGLCPEAHRSGVGAGRRGRRVPGAWRHADSHAHSPRGPSKTTDILTRLQQLAPDPVDLDNRWPADARAELARQIVADEVGARARRRHRTRPSRPRERRVAAYLVVAALAAAVTVPALL
ncbi:MAG: hypothetical protein LH468_05740, partial [Nocardioides sp.]|nr:hypothetical protein [Nocardioides sp.]